MFSILLNFIKHFKKVPTYPQIKLQIILLDLSNTQNYCTFNNYSYSDMRDFYVQ